MEIRINLSSLARPDPSQSSFATSLDGACPDFVAIDVETANANLASICQVGLVGYKDGAVCGVWKSLVNPEEPFDEMNSIIHGITPRMVKKSPTFPSVRDSLNMWLTGRVVVCHTAFDRVAIARVSARYDLPAISCTWLDTARVARRTWPDCAYSGYGLGRLAEKLEIDYCAHDAEEDARACGELLLRATRETGLDLAGWLERVKQPINPNASGHWPSAHVAMVGNPDGDLYGDVIVFTGALQIPRVEAAKLAAHAGCEVADGVNKRTTMVVVGDQDIRRLAGQEKSGKHRKAEALVAKGQAIRIMCESDFLQIVRCHED